MPPETPLLVDTGRGFSLRWRDKWLYSSRSPCDAPARAAQAAPALHDTLYVVPSPCLCHGLPELLAAMPASSSALCVERDAALAGLAIERIRELGLEGGRLAFASCADAAGAVAAARALGSHRRAVEVRLSQGWSLYPGFYATVMAALDADISNRYRNRLAMVRMGRLWTRNLLANLADMDWEAVEPLDLGARPLVVCGAGASLTAAMPLLRRLKGAATVLACDTAAGALALSGVAPDAVVCLEGQVYNLPDFLPLDRAGSRLVVDLSAHPSSFRASGGRRSLVLSEWDDSAFLGRVRRAGLPVSPVPPLGSVGVLALRLALDAASRSGAPVFIAGLDFAYPAGRTHAAGTPVDLAEGRAETRLYKRGGRWDGSFRDGVRRLGGGLSTDAVLTMYAGLAAAELSSASASVRAYDLRGGAGLELPAERVGDEEALAIASSWPRDDVARATYGTDGPRRWRAAALGFLEGELSLVAKTSRALREGAEPAALRALLSEADFLYGHFPDPGRVLALELDALRRVAAEAAYWRGRLEAAVGAARAPR